jgi:hypothetical protein
MYMQEYIFKIYAIAIFILAALSLFMLLYSHIKGIKEESHIYFWKGTLFLSISMLLPELRYFLPPSSSNKTILVAVSSLPLIYSIYLLRKAVQIEKTIDGDSHGTIDISNPVGLAFGIVTLLFVPVSGFFAVSLMLGPFVGGSLDIKEDWTIMIAAVIVGVLSSFLAVVGWRLINVRKGWKGNLFSPVTLWFRLAGWLFLIMGLIKLIQRNLTGVWAVLIGGILIFLFREKAKNNDEEIKASI